MSGTGSDPLGLEYDLSEHVYKSIIVNPGLTVTLIDEANYSQQRIKYGSTISENVCQELGYMSEIATYATVVPDYTSYRTVELYRNTSCTGQAFVAGIESGESQVDVNADDLGDGIWNNQAVAMKISPGL